MNEPTDIYERLLLIRDAAGDRVDPVWIELAIVEIERLHGLVSTWADATDRHTDGWLSGTWTPPEQVRMYVEMSDAADALRHEVKR